jgi:hypothetical protein
VESASYLRKGRSGQQVLDFCPGNDLFQVWFSSTGVSSAGPTASGEILKPFLFDTTFANYLQSPRTEALFVCLLFPGQTPQDVPVSALDFPIEVRHSVWGDQMYRFLGGKLKAAIGLPTLLDKSKKDSYRQGRMKHEQAYQFSAGFWWWRWH